MYYCVLFAVFDHFNLLFLSIIHYFKRSAAAVNCEQSQRMIDHIMIALKKGCSAGHIRDKYSLCGFFDFLIL